MVAVEFGFSQIKIVNCRSKGDHNDSDWLTLAVTYGQTVLPPQTRLLGDNLHAGDGVQSFHLGPFIVDETKLVTATVTVVNLRQSDNQEAKAEALGLAIVGGLAAVTGGVEALVGELLEEAAVKIVGGIIATVGGVLSTIGVGIGVSDSDPACDGEVFTRVFTFLPGELNAGTPSKFIPPLGEPPMTETARSPSECGNDPHTEVRYLVPSPKLAVQVEHVAAGAADGSLLVFFFTPDKDWQVINVSSQVPAVRGQKIGGPPSAAWVVGNVEHVAAGSPQGDLLVFFFTPDKDWQVVNVSDKTRTKIAGPPSGAWVTGNVEHVAAGAADGSLLVFFFTPDKDWQVINVSSQVPAVRGQKNGGPPSAAWVVGNVV
jgi:hypothetical protein